MEWTSSCAVRSRGPRKITPSRVRSQKAKEQAPRAFATFYELLDFIASGPGTIVAVSDANAFSDNPDMSPSAAPARLVTSARSTSSSQSCGRMPSAARTGPGTRACRGVPLTRSALDAVYREWGRFAAWELREMTHAEGPWCATARQGVIETNVMLDYFEQQLRKHPLRV